MISYYIHSHRCENLKSKIDIKIVVKLGEEETLKMFVTIVFKNGYHSVYFSEC
jgi:hypothetical protein